MYASVFAIVLVIGSTIILLNVTYMYRRFSDRELSQTAAKVADYINSGGQITEDAVDSLNSNKSVVIGVSEIGRGILRNLFFPFPMNVYTKNPQPGQSVVIQAVKYMYDQDVAYYNGRSYLISVFRDYDQENQVINIFTGIYSLVILFGVIGAYLLGRTISRVTLRPIRRITQTAERLGIEDLSQRIEMNGPDDEIKELALTFNAMIGRLEVSFRQQKQFVDDASHELRTPISVIQGYANLLDRWGKNDTSILQESIDSIKAETDHMGKLVKRLLFMAKAEQNKMQVSKQPLHLKDVVDEVIKELDLTGRSHKIHLETDGGDKIPPESDGGDMIDGDYDLIKQLLWIFTENAVKYSKTPEDQIWFHIYNEPSLVCLSIKDEGIGIGREDLPYIFERFYRADKSRTNQSQAPGTGLGLSIATWIIKQHDATINVESELGQGTTITLKFKALQ